MQKKILAQKVGAGLYFLAYRTVYPRFEQHSKCGWLNTGVGIRPRCENRSNS
jgi:hypothetical protein